MNHCDAQSTMSSLESDSKNYKSLYEEIAQNDSQLYLNNSKFDESVSYGDETTECCCCEVHRRRNSSFIAGGAVTKTFNIPIYNTIWIGEMKNATDYIEYLNETRRNSFSSLNKDNRSNYYKLLLDDNHSMNNDSKVCNNNGISNSGNFLQVPTLHFDERLCRTPEFDDISKKIDQIHLLNSSVSSLIYKSIEVHADILVRKISIDIEPSFHTLLKLLLCSFCFVKGWGVYALWWPAGSYDSLGRKIFFIKNQGFLIEVDLKGAGRGAMGL